MEMPLDIAPALQLLPASPYATVALPLDYPPSRDLRPRWRDKPIAPLMAWCEASDEAFADFLSRMPRYRAELAAISIPRTADHKPSWTAPFCAFDLAALYTMIRETRPARYLEIGSGNSTRWVRQAIADGGLETKIIAIDPDPRVEIAAVCDELISAGLEECDLSVFEQLEAGDIVFFDGSHRAFMNSDVTVFMIEVLPRLKPGVLIHIHDVALPWDYPEWAVNWYWNEQYILAAYLIAAKDRVKAVLPTSYVCRAPGLASFFSAPLVDLGEKNDGWTGGGSMWFTHA